MKTESLPRYSTFTYQLQALKKPSIPKHDFSSLSVKNKFELQKPATRTSYIQTIYSDTVYEVRYNPDQYVSGGDGVLGKGISCDFGDDIEQYTMVYILKGNL